AMRDETWMSAGEALRLGYATAITAPTQIAASAIDLSRFRRVPVDAIAIAARARSTAARPGAPVMGPIESAARMTVDRQLELMDAVRTGRMPSAARGGLARRHDVVAQGIDRYLSSRGSREVPPAARPA